MQIDPPVSWEEQQYLNVKHANDTLTAANRQLRERVAELTAARKQDAIDGQAALDEANNTVARLKARLAEVERQAEMYAENCTNKIQEVLALTREGDTLQRENADLASENADLANLLEAQRVISEGLAQKAIARERENERLRGALGECIKTFDYLVFHRVAGMDALLYESHNRTSPGRTVETAKRLARQALHAARPGEEGK